MSVLLTPEPPRRRPRPAPVRVAHVTLGLDVGGQEKLLVEFARLADRRRFELLFVSLSTRGVLAADLEAHGWPVVALGEPPGLRPGLVLRLAWLFRRQGVAVVHTHDDKPLVYAPLAARLAGVRRVVHTRHGRSFGASPRQALLMRLSAGLVDRVVCVSHDSARQSVGFGIPIRKVCAVWNGIDAARFAYCGPCPDGPVVTVARLSPEKDLETLLKATALAAACEPGFRLEIAGDGPCGAELRRTAAELGLGERVRFLGEVRDVPGLLERARLFALSSASEGVSLTLLEAMGRGLPCVATHVGGNPEVVSDGETGLLVGPRDPGALADAMLQLWRDPRRRTALGLAGRRRVLEHFEVRRMVGRYEELYGSAQRRSGETGCAEP
jgi:glycosyltransferase involved in cell wall biosynthesis